MSQVYFLYSDEQIEEKNKILLKTGKKFLPGNVVVNGKRVKFTQIHSSATMLRFVDTKIVASGELSSFTYTEPQIISAEG
ncbi:MAG: hypothetical protein IKR19_07500 [Acholeplasmatales bacterium]|nr:hypothetical protein [Acholeplasmatales bacterium]